MRCCLPHELRWFKLELCLCCSGLVRVMTGSVRSAYTDAGDGGTYSTADSARLISAMSVYYCAMCPNTAFFLIKKKRLFGAPATLEA